eukprot:CAMPEP_0182531842 /NCGR_PEP_ID=MMETSP1323-20130603/10185_1 /TAXON_ID=236787 /ORGANISM="Florenciella parvula, Strain RCC1693" /LENGTH=65 /DNA_ID=CAMNT_0024741485 /DNA_START=516 /DNA_END=713 /DNA_ORIENTATION=-
MPVERPARPGPQCVARASYDSAHVGGNAPSNADARPMARWSSSGLRGVRDPTAFVSGRVCVSRDR